MKTILTYISLGVLTASSALCQIIAQPQTATASETSQGSLGKRYAGLSFGVSDLKGTEYVFGTGVGVNAPVTNYLDASVGYSYSWYKNDALQYYTYKYDTHSLNTDFVFYKTIAGGLKPFISAGIGYAWTTREFEYRSSYFNGDFKMKDDFATWGTSVGIEIPLRWIALTPSIGLSGDFENERSQTWNYGLQASSWITPKVGIQAGVAFSEPKSRDYDGNWSYSAGIRIKF